MFKIITIFFMSFLLLSCSKKVELKSQNTAKCDVYKNYTSATFEVSGDMAELVEKSAKKALTKSCLKRLDSSTSNLRVKIDSKQTLQSTSGIIKDSYNNTLSITITATMLTPTEDGGLTTTTSKQQATLNLTSSIIADIGPKSELSAKEVAPFVEKNVAITLENLLKDMP